MKLVKLLLIVFGLSIFIFRSYTQTENVFFFTLGEAQEFALENNKQIQSSKIDLEIAEKKIWETTAIGLPHFDINANYQHLFDLPEFGFPVSGFIGEPLYDDINRPESFNESSPDGLEGISQYYYEGPKFPLGSKDNTIIDFVFSQLIFSGEYIVGLQASKVYKRLSEQNLVKSEIDIKQEVANSYLLILVTGVNLSILEESLGIVKQTHKEVELMFQNGFIEEMDVDQLLLNVKKIESLLLSIKNQKRIADKILKFQLGIDFEKKVILKDSINNIIVLNDLNLVTSTGFDIDNNINYQLITTQENLALLNLKRERYKVLPTISGFYQHEKQTDEAEFNFMPKDIVGVSLNFPIFSSGQRATRISQASLELQKTKLAKEQVKQSLIMEYDRSRNDFLLAGKNYLINKENLELSKNIFDKTAIKYKQGMASSMELSQANNQYLESNTTFINSLYNLFIKKVKLDKINSNL